jgi:hypothetical protein
MEEMCSFPAMTPLCECSRYFFPRRDECAASDSSSISAAGNETATEERIMIMVMIMIPPAHSYH